MKFFTLRMLFLSLLLCVGSGAWAETDIYTFTSKSWEATLGSTTSNWITQRSWRLRARKQRKLRQPLVSIKKKGRATRTAVKSLPAPFVF